MDNMKEISCNLYTFDFFENQIVMLLFVGDYSTAELDRCRKFFKSIENGTKTIEEAEKIFIVEHYREFHLINKMQDLSDEQILSYHKNFTQTFTLHSQLQKILPKLQAILKAISRDKQIDEIIE